MATFPVVDLTADAPTVDDRAESGREEQVDQLLSDADAAANGDDATAVWIQLYAIGLAAQAQAEATLALAAEVRELRRFLVNLDADDRAEL